MKINWYYSWICYTVPSSLLHPCCMCPWAPWFLRLLKPRQGREEAIATAAWRRGTGIACHSVRGLALPQVPQPYRCANGAQKRRGRAFRLSKPGTLFFFPLLSSSYTCSVVPICLFVFFISGADLIDMWDCMWPSLVDLFALWLSVSLSTHPWLRLTGSFFYSSTLVRPIDDFSLIKKVNPRGFHRWATLMVKKTWERGEINFCRSIDGAHPTNNKIFWLGSLDFNRAPHWWFYSGVGPHWWV